jgi:hypothetical protein
MALSLENKMFPVPTPGKRSKQVSFLVFGFRNWNLIICETQCLATVVYSGKLSYSKDNLILVIFKSICGIQINLQIIWCSVLWHFEDFGFVGWQFFLLYSLILLPSCQSFRLLVQQPSVTFPKTGWKKSLLAPRLFASRRYIYYAYKQGH